MTDRISEIKARRAAATPDDIDYLLQLVEDKDADRRKRVLRRLNTAFHKLGTDRAGHGTGTSSDCHACGQILKAVFGVDIVSSPGSTEL